MKRRVLRRYKVPHPSWIIVLLAIGVIIGDVLMLVFGGMDGGEVRKLAGETVVVSGTVTEDPDTSESKTAYRLGSLRICVREWCDNSSMEGWREISGMIYVSGAVNRELKRSEIITVSGKISEGFGTFGGVMYRPTVLKIMRPEPGDVFLKVRDWFAGGIRKYIEEPEVALGLGYLLGARSSLPEGLAETLKVVGLTHIIVASGSNLSILVSFSRKVFGRVSRWFAMFISLLLVLFYVGMVGLSPSMVRAGMVAILSLVAWYYGRKFAAWRILLLVAAGTLIYNPMYLVDLGWLLSFGSFAGIMILGPILTRMFYGEAEPNFIGATIIETAAASILCLPILLYFFGQMSVISIIANLLVLPTISAAMGLTFLTGIFAVFWPLGAGIVGALSGMVLKYNLWVINFFGGMEMFLINVPAENPLVFLIYVPVILIVIKENIKIGDGDTGGKDWPFYGVYNVKNLKRKVVENEEVAKGAGAKTSEKGGIDGGFTDTKDTKEPAATTPKIKKKRQRKDEYKEDNVANEFARKIIDVISDEISYIRAKHGVY